MKRLKLDSHKLTYHLPRLYQWYKGVDIYPIYIEVGLYGGCNHRCIFCAFDFLKYKPESLSLETIKRFIYQTVSKGVKSILYSGEGEPLLHNDIAEIVKFTKNNGIDTALSTNGVKFNQKMSEKILPFLSWVRISLNGGAKENYASIHQTKKDDFETVVNNVKKAVKIKNKNKLKCTIGVQFLLIPQNYKEIFKLISVLKDSGIDYLVIKPYSEHPSTKKKSIFILENINLDKLENKINKISKKQIKIIFRHQTMVKMKEKKPYEHCLGLPFIAHVSADGSVYPCNNFIGNKEFILGNLYSQTFEEIWQSQKRKMIMKRIYEKWDVTKCRKACRIDDINCYLWELKHPDGHVNFI